MPSPSGLGISSRHFLKSSIIFLLRFLHLNLNRAFPIALGTQDDSSGNRSHVDLFQIKDVSTCRADMNAFPSTFVVRILDREVHKALIHRPGAICEALVLPRSRWPDSNRYTQSFSATATGAAWFGLSLSVFRNCSDSKMNASSITVIFNMTSRSLVRVPVCHCSACSNRKQRAFEEAQPSNKLRVRLHGWRMAPG